MGKLTCEVYWDPSSNNMHVFDFDREDFESLRAFLIDLGKDTSDGRNVIPAEFTWQSEDGGITVPPATTAMFTWPTMVDWQVTQNFGENPDEYPLTDGHEGMDIWAPGTEVYAVMDGEVYSSGAQHAGTSKTSKGKPHPYGRHVRIQHDDNLKTAYAHLSKSLVQPGQAVTAGEQIGVMGSSGNSTGRHLHLTVYENGVIRNPAAFLGVA